MRLFRPLMFSALLAIGNTSWLFVHGLGSNKKIVALR
jgi:hypothetical protein